jgi:hypothetical protein
VALALIALIRLATAVPGSMAGWGFGLLCFTPPALGWTVLLESLEKVRPPDGP